MIFKLEKMQKRKHMENQKAKLQNWKKNGSKINGEKRNVKKGKTTWEKNGFVHLHFCCIYFAFSDLLCFCFYFAFFCFFPGKKQPKKTNRESKINAKKMQMDKSIVFPSFSLFVFPLFSLCFPFYFAFVFFGFCWFAFWFFLVFAFVAFFSSFKKVRISGGLADINITMENHFFYRENS